MSVTAPHRTYPVLMPDADLLALTASLVAIPSVSHEEAALTDHLERELRALPHLVVERVGANLVARTQLGRSRRVLLAGHTDTVPVNGNAEPRVEGDVLWGLGSTDMKGGLAVMLALAREVSAPTVDVTYVFYAGEEVAAEHNGLAHLLRDRPDLLEGDVAILGEPTGGELEVGCQGTLRVEVTLRGERAHTARPWMGRNAIHRLGAAAPSRRGVRGAGAGDRGLPATARRCRPSSSRAVSPATWCPTSPLSRSTAASRRTAPSRRRPTRCAPSWRPSSRTATR